MPLHQALRVGAVLLVGVVLALAAVGCKSTREEAPGYPCNVGEGEYLDIETHACVTVFNRRTKELLPGKDYETLYRLYNYWVLLRQTAKDDAAVLHQVSFAEYESATSFSDIITAQSIERIDAIAFYVPHVLGGWFALVQLPPTSTKETALTDAERQLQASSFSPAEHEYNDALAFAIASRDYKIGGMRIIARPSAMASYWREHAKLVRFIQLVAGPLGLMQPLYEPGQEVSP